MILSGYGEYQPDPKLKKNTNNFQSVRIQFLLIGIRIHNIALTVETGVVVRLVHAELHHDHDAGDYRRYKCSNRQRPSNKTRALNPGILIRLGSYLKKFGSGVGHNTLSSIANELFSRKKI